MLTFIGLGLYDERSITVEGQDALSEADRAFAEFYTSKLAGATVEDLEVCHETEIEVRDRAGIERDPGPILEAAEDGRAAFLTAGDPFISTTHVDLRLRAVNRDIDTRVVHGTTAETAATSLTGLQNYRFGKATTLPFPDAHGGRPAEAASDERADAPTIEDVPESVLDTLDANRDRGLHTLIYLDIKADRGEYMTADRGAALLSAAYGDVLAVAVCRAGGPDPVVAADRLPALAAREFGDPLHLLVMPGELHHVERNALRTLGDAPAELLN